MDKLVIEPMVEDLVGMIGEAKSDGGTMVGLRVCGLNPRSEIWGFGASEGSGGLSIIYIIFRLIHLFLFNNKSNF